MIEQEYLKYCLEEIEQNLNWKSSSDWKESDFVKLSEIISKKSNISISPHTLKRLFGKIKYKEYYNPQQATKNALAKFLEYSDWRDYVTVLKNKLKNGAKKEKKGIKSKKRLIVVFILFGMLSLVLINPFKKAKKENSVTGIKENFEFSLVDSVGIVPYTVSVNYNLSKITSDSALIDFGFNHPVKGPQFMLVDKGKYIRNFTYQIPGQYIINLVNDKEILSSKKVLAMSDGWDSYFNPEANTGSYWIDNKIEKDSVVNNLYYAPEYLDSIGFDTNQVYYVTHRLFKEFGTNGDNFEFKARFKNSEKLGGITCYDFILRIICENQINNIKLMEDGCSQFTGMKIGETVLSGDNEDLSSFKFNLGVWNDLKLEVHNKSVKFFINESKIYDGGYAQSNGKIVGLEITFKGAGALDFINIKDLDTQKVYRDNF